MRAIDGFGAVGICRKILTEGIEEDLIAVLQSETAKLITESADDGDAVGVRGDITGTTIGPAVTPTVDMNGFKILAIAQDFFATIVSGGVDREERSVVFRDGPANRVLTAAGTADELSSPVGCKEGTVQDGVEGTSDCTYRAMLSTDFSRIIAETERYQASESRIFEGCQSDST